MKIIATFAFIFLGFQSIFAQEVARTNFPKEVQTVKRLPLQQSLWVFVMAGQSNMAGRGLVEPQDTLPHPRIFTVGQNDEIILAKEPLHYYEPTRTGLDCGLSFAHALLKSLPDSVSILLVPVAIGGSSIQQWLGDSLFREVKLLSNAKKKIAIAQNVGVMKGILWHQGETNAMSNIEVEQHSVRLKELVDVFRTVTINRELPFLLAELPSFSNYQESFLKINEQLLAFTKTDKYSVLIKTGDLKHKGDALHFNSQAQRLMGERFAQAYISNFLQKGNAAKK